MAAKMRHEHMLGYLRTFWAAEEGDGFIEEHFMRDPDTEEEYLELVFDCPNPFFRTEGIRTTSPRLEDILGKEDLNDEDRDYLEQVIYNLIKVHTGWTVVDYDGSLLHATTITFCLSNR